MLLGCSADEAASIAQAPAHPANQERAAERRSCVNSRLSPCTCPPPYVPSHVAQVHSVTLSAAEKMLFCPSCANLLIISTETGYNKWACNTCAYEFPITKQVGTEGPLRGHKTDGLLDDVENATG